jgi:hypothetical protein
VGHGPTVPTDQSAPIVLIVRHGHLELKGRTPVKAANARRAPSVPRAASKAHVPSEGDVRRVLVALLTARPARHP